ncbi:hypothetical protein SLA2020_030880 [Shorea laevis]
MLLSKAGHLGKDFMLPSWIMPAVLVIESGLKQFIYLFIAGIYKLIYIRQDTKSLWLSGYAFDYREVISDGFQMGKGLQY